MRRRLSEIMQSIAEFMNKQPDYRYFKVNDERADIFIYKFIEEIDSNGIGGGTISFDEEENVINVEVNEDNHVYSYKVCLLYTSDAADE